MSDEFFFENAFCHANYCVGSNIKVEFFPNECRGTSPGGIYRATLDDLMDGIQTYRNPRLVNIFDKLGLIENFGMGIPRVLEAYAPFGEKPEFKPLSFFIRKYLRVGFMNGTERVLL